MESDKEQARWLIKCVSDGRMTGGMAAEIEDYCFARRTELEKLTAERDHLRILYNTARDGMREVGELLETCRIELAESRAEVGRLRGELDAHVGKQALKEMLRQMLATADERDQLRNTVAGLRRALEEIANDGVERSRDPRTLIAQAALAASSDEHGRRLKAEALRALQADDTFTECTGTREGHNAIQRALSAVLDAMEKEKG